MTSACHYGKRALRLSCRAAELLRMIRYKLVELVRHAAAGLGLGIGLPAFFISRDNADEVGQCSRPSM